MEENSGMFKQEEGKDYILVKNMAKCLECGEIIESKSCHDYKTCKCGNLSVDGGLYYLKRGIRDGMESWEDMSEYEEIVANDEK